MIDLPELPKPEAQELPANKQLNTVVERRATWRFFPKTGEHRRAVEALSLIRNFEGGSQPKVMLCSDRQCWVVKFQNNPQHPFILANEMLATNLAKRIGLPVPDCTVIEVSPRLILDTPWLIMHEGKRRFKRCSAGRQFGSRLVGGALEDRAWSFISEGQLERVQNVDAFAGILCFDKWTGNGDGRQAVFKLHRKTGNYKAYFIDHGFCFNASEWSFLDSPLRGIYSRNYVYAGVTGWDSFEPWLRRIENFSLEAIWEAAEDIPPEWYGGNAQRLDHLLEQLYMRRSKVRGLIEEFRDSTREPFPLWTGRKPGERPNYSFL